MVQHEIENKSSFPNMIIFFNILSIVVRGYCDSTQISKVAHFGFTVSANVMTNVTKM